MNDSPYKTWLESNLSKEVQENSPQPEQIANELVLQAKWFHGELGNEFTDNQGRSISVQYFGEWNRGAGPDFNNVIATIDGSEVRGDVEFDLTSRDWENHGHDQNAQFDKVLFHLVFFTEREESFCRNSQNRLIPRCFVSKENQERAIGSPIPAQTPLAMPGNCSPEFQHWSLEKINELLKLSAHHRLTAKARTFSLQAKHHGIEQAIWSALATTIGYRPNKDAFMLLSQRVPIKDLLSSEYRDSAESILFGISDFLAPKLHEKAPSDSQAYIENLWEEWWKHRRNFELISARSIPYQFHQLRPVNHPQRRVAALVSIAKEWKSIFTLFQGIDSAKAKTLKKLLTTLSHPFWDHHYTLTSERTSRKMSLFGTEKFSALMINFLVPYWMTQLEPEAWNFFTTQRGQTSNTLLKKASARLFPHLDPKEVTQLAYQQQGLLQLYTDFCQHTGCLQCPLNEQLPKLALK